jgi:formylglycine-generating enzyme required for sulfatase activity
LVQLCVLVFLVGCPTGDDDDTTGDDDVADNDSSDDDTGDDDDNDTSGDDDAPDDDSGDDDNDSSGDDDVADDDSAGDDDSAAFSGMVYVPAGTFSMGSPMTEVGRDGNEDEHWVTLTRAFYIGETEVTQLDFLQLTGWNPYSPGLGFGDAHPVYNVSWYDAVAYANAVSAAAGLTACYDLSDVECEDWTDVGTSYMDCLNMFQGGIAEAEVSLNGVTTPYECEGHRLPTEAEWEYAARAGEMAAFPNGGNLYPGDESTCGLDLMLDNGTYLGDIAWFCGNDSWTSEHVGSLLPNSWGLHDVCGNVMEWVWDWFVAPYGGDITDPPGPEDSSYKSNRGGSWNLAPRHARVADRNYFEPNVRYHYLGFRLAITSP